MIASLKASGLVQRGVVLALLGLPMAARAQDSTKVVIDTITIQTARTPRWVLDSPAAVSAIAIDDRIHQMPNLTTADILRTVPGLQFTPRYNGGLGERLVMRGAGARASFGIRGTYISLDGIPLTFPDGQAQLQGIDMAGMQGLTVIKGPAAAQLAYGAMGALQFTSLRPTHTFEAQAQTLFGSFDQQRHFLALGSRIKGWELSVQGSIQQFGGYRPNSSAYNQYVYTRIAHTGSRGGYVQFTYSNLNAPLWLNPSSLTLADAQADPRQTRAFVIQQGAGKSVKQGIVSLLWEKEGQRQSHNVFHVSITGLDRGLTNPIPGAFITTERSSWRIRTSYGNLTSSKYDRFRWEIGFQSSASIDQRQEYDNLGVPAGASVPGAWDDSAMRGTRRVNQQESAYADQWNLLLQYDLTPKLALTGGFVAESRSAWVTREPKERRPWFLSIFSIFDKDNQIVEYSNNAPFVGVKWKVKPSQQLYFNVSRGFQAPTLVELTNLPSADTTRWLNYDLQTEATWALEAGWNGTEGAFTWQSALYVNLITNQILPFQNPGSSEVTYFRNAGRSYLIGLESALTWQFSPQWTFIGALTVQEARFTEYELQGVDLKGKRQPAIPPVNLAVQALWKPWRALSLMANARYTSGFPLNDFNGTPPGSLLSDADTRNPGLVMLDVQAGWTWQWGRHRVDLTGGVNNLLNQRWYSGVVPNAAAGRYFEPGPPINVWTNLSWRFANGRTR